MCQVRRRDNFFAAVHMAVEAIFWFHPLIWWIGSRMIEERELACDEEVLRMGCEPTDYVQGILKVCRFYTESPLPCISGVTGADIKKRLQAILAGSIARELSGGNKLTLATIGLAVLVAPIAVGIVNAPFVRAQSSAAQKRLTFEAASVKPATVPAGVMVRAGGGMVVRRDSGIEIPRNTGGPGTDDPGRIHYPLINLRQLMSKAYESYFEINGPDWLYSEYVQVDATMPNGTTNEQFKEMLRNLITERFGLRYHTQTKQISGFALVVSKSGPKLRESLQATPCKEIGRERRKIGLDGRPEPRKMGADGFEVSPTCIGPHFLFQSEAGYRARMIGQAKTMQEFSNTLGPMLHAKIEDSTGPTSKYDIVLTYAGSLTGPLIAAEPPAVPDSASTGVEMPPDIFSALQSQLGLKMERKLVPVEVFVVDHMEKTPTGN